LSLNNLLFYFYFEASLIPTFLLILGWGNQPERLQSGLYLLFYTLTASLPLLAIILILFNLTIRLSINSIYFFITNKINLFLFLAFIIAFLVKIPIFLVHL
jgi:NADH-ubiquinone oxidoreductase chain 4